MPEAFPSPLKIVVLDGHTLNPGDLDWSPLTALGPCTIHDRTAPDAVAERAAGAQVLLTNKTALTRGQIDALPDLRYIGVLATGYNVVDIAAAREREIPVCNVPGYGAQSVAQHVFALLLELTQRTGHHAETVAEGRWGRNPDFCYWDFPLVELHGRILGIVGYGAIGRAAAEIGRAFGMKVLVASRTPSDGQVSIDEVFAQADVVSLHCPLTPETDGLVNAGRLKTMRPGGFLINTSRGGLVVEQDLADALNHGVIAGAGLDVLSVEPPPADNPLFRAKNCLITPHIAWATQASRQRLLDIAVENVRAFLGGVPTHVINH
jgi:glycerate dehydrogenase